MICFVIVSCLKDNNPDSISGLSNPLAQSRSVPTEYIKVTGKDGICYLFTINRYDDNSINVTKSVTECDSDSFTRIGLVKNDSTYLDPHTNKLVFPEDVNYWYIPIDDEKPPIHLNRFNNTTIECWCEGSIPEPGYDPGICEPCESWNSCICNSSGCTDCDARICTPSLVLEPDANGIIVSGTRINSRKTANSNTVSYYGNNVEVKVQTRGDSTIIRRKEFFGVTSLPLVNLTNHEIVDGRLNLPGGSYWLIPFEYGGSIQLISNPTVFHCDSDPEKPCSGECTLEKHTNGCDYCKCSTSGDCDMKKDQMVIGGGVLVQATNISLTDI
jgi:hypothetical protein